MTLRSKIIDVFARWTALSALRSGARHPKSRDAVYRALDSIDFSPLFDADQPAIAEAEFADWHRANVEKLSARGFCVGWAAKLINVYLKTRVYVGSDGRAGLAELIHPPIDNGLWRGIRKEFPKDGAVRSLMHPRDGGRRVTTIGAITTYDAYSTIIDGCRHIAN